ncbi:MAG: LPS assembly lipoprotein LptE [Bacteroidales bacterium]|nr:LPS assembly lipoprotein LptE [Bacteroidales bacterium]
MTQTVRTALLALAATLLLAGCGWQLRGAGLVPEGLDTLHITSRDPYSPLVMELTRTLRAANVRVTDSAAEAPYALAILDQRSGVRTATVNANARVSEQELSEEVEFLIIDRDGNTLLPRSTVLVERVFEYDETNVLATRDEEQLIRGEMRRDLVSQILNRFRQIQDLQGKGGTGAPAP